MPQLTFMYNKVKSNMKAQKALQICLFLVIVIARSVSYNLFAHI